MELDIVMLNVLKHLLFQDKLTLVVNTELVAMSLIYGKQTKKLMFLQVILAELQDITDARELNVEMEMNVIMEYVIRMVAD